MVALVGEFDLGLEVFTIIDAAIDWRAFRVRVPEAADIGLLEQLIHPGDSQTERPRDLRSRIANTDDRLAAALDYVVDCFARVTRIPRDTLDSNRPIVEYGINSLMATEIKTTVASELGVSLSLSRVLGGCSLGDVASAIDADLPTMDDEFEEGEI